VQILSALKEPPLAGVTCWLQCFDRQSIPYHSFLITSDSARTSMSPGHSTQSCIQQTMTSQFFGSCPCSIKFLLANSNSILMDCHLPRDTCCLASQSGKLPCTASTRYPSSRVTISKRNTTPCSLTGSCLNPESRLSCHKSAELASSPARSGNGRRIHH
jgi:hypothetical protein